MTKLTKAQQAKREEALISLREWMPKGSTVYTILRRVSRSGMSRDISLVVLGYQRWRGDAPHMIHPNHSAAIVLRERLVNANGSDALRIGGCGMDMGFHVVNSLAYALYNDGTALRHEWL